MPQGKSSSNGGSSKSSDNRTSSSKTANTGGDRSNNSYYKQFGGWPGFMHSHGLKPWDHGDVQEGRAILEGYKAIDRENSRK